MTTKSKAETLSMPLTGADHRAMALLRHIAGADSAGHWGYDQLSPYIAAARSIVRSRHAFTGETESLSIEAFVMKTDRFVKGDGLTERDKAVKRVIAQIIEGAEGTPVTADAWDLLSFVYGVIAESQLYGAAVMYELLKDGTR